MVQFQILNKGQVLGLSNQSLSLRVSRGKVWLTLANDNKDYVLQEGETFDTDLNPLIVIEALEETSLLYSAQTTEPLPTAHLAGARSASVETDETVRAASAR